MAKRGYKLQEYVAHTSDVSCLYIGKKSCRVFLTGGDDRKVNLWAVGKPTSLLSLSGHSSSVQSVTFDSAEVLVLAGSSNGTIKLWDLEEAKIVRTLTGHRSSCTSVEFHPFGEFFATGSLDTDLKIWDIRKKGCIHTYKGHTRGIRTIRFTPDGRWVVTGGEDNVVKIWDLTAGKLLHDFKFHNGIIRCIDFHPQEFLLATGSADRTVKFWDLETFELIGSAGPEATGVRAMVFHPDGRTLFCGLEENLKVFSWEPIRCHDVVDMGWSKLGDLSIYEGKLVGCSYHQNRVGVWFGDISLVGPYSSGVMPKKNGLMELNGSSEDSNTASTNMSPDCGVKSGETMRTPVKISSDCSESILQRTDPVYLSNATSPNSTVFKRNRDTLTCHTTPQKFNLKFSSKVSALSSSRTSHGSEVSHDTPNRTESSFASKEMLPKRVSSNNFQTLKNGLMVELDTLNNASATGRAVSMPIVVPRDILDQESAARPRNASATTIKMASSTMPFKLNHIQKPSYAGGVRNSQLVETISRSSTGMTDDLGDTGSNFLSMHGMNGESIASDEAKCMDIKNVAQKFERSLSVEHSMRLRDDKDSEAPCSSSSESSSVKYVKGVAVQLGRTRSLVERFERREKCNSNSMATISSLSEQGPKSDNLPSLLAVQVNTSERDLVKAADDLVCETLLQNHDVFINVIKSRLTKLQVVLHFWERNGIRGAIDAVAKLPDHAVQVDVVSVLKDKIDLFTLDKFACLLPVLAGLLNSKTERHATISLETLLELVKIYGPVIRSTISASSLVGIDLQAEQRLERSNKCYNQLEKIKQILPLMIRKGGLLAKYAQELSTALQD